MSEQQFSASLEAEVERPRFVVDLPEDTGGEQPQTMADKPPKPALSEAEGSVSIEPSSISITEISQETPLVTSGDSPREPAWRDQVAAKVSSYKSRRPREDRYPSLQLQFEVAPDDVPQPAPRHPDGRPTFSQSSAIQSAATHDIERQAAPLISLEATARVIQFPRSSAAPVTKDQLADPVVERPRILEAPDLLPLPPALGGILIEPTSQPEPERRAGFEMPLQSATLSRRLFAGAIDAVVVAIALAAFRYVLLRISGTLLQWRTAVELALGLLAVLWPAYQYAFLVFCGTTPGLRLAQLQIARFDGTPASRSLRRWRVIASLLSCVSLGLGYAWCFLDEDQLSWHDRITRTHLGPKP